MLTNVLKERIQHWAENEVKLCELQNGFWKGRRLEDNLIILTKTIEIAIQKRKPLYLAFLDISKAYDSVDHRLLWLWQGLDQLDMPDKWRQMLQEIYRKTSIVMLWGEEYTNSIKSTRGLRQESPLLPLLFMRYIAAIEGEL